MLTKVMFLYYRRYLCVSTSNNCNSYSRMFEVSFQLSEFPNQFKMAVLNPKFGNVVELILQHVSSLCIDFSKMNKLGGLDKCV